MLYPELEEKLHNAGRILTQATSENIIELCKQYLALLAEYRNKLYELQGTSEILRRSASAPPSEDNREIRKAIRAAIESTTLDRNRTERLLLSFTTVSGYEAVKLFNQLKYEGHDDWELRASGVKSSSNPDRNLMTIQEAVEAASTLRREEYIAQFAGQSSG